MASPPPGQRTPAKINDNAEWLGEVIRFDAISGGRRRGVRQRRGFALRPDAHQAGVPGPDHGAEPGGGQPGLHHHRSHRLPDPRGQPIRAATAPPACWRCPSRTSPGTTWCCSAPSGCGRCVGLAKPGQDQYEYGPNGPRLTPRKSFEEWSELVKGQGGALHLVRAAGGRKTLRTALLEVVLRLADVAAGEERQRAHEQQQLLIAELNHRVRNILSADPRAHRPERPVRHHGPVAGFVPPPWTTGCKRWRGPTTRSPPRPLGAGRAAHRPDRDGGCGLSRRASKTGSIACRGPMCSSTPPPSPCWLWSCTSCSPTPPNTARSQFRQRRGGHRPGGWPTTTGS